MKKRILLAISVMLILGLSIAVFAFTKTNSTLRASAVCCCKDGACPIKNKTGKDGDCCDKPDCCKKGESCPMKKHEK